MDNRKTENDEKNKMERESHNFSCMEEVKVSFVKIVRLIYYYLHPKKSSLLVLPYKSSFKVKRDIGIKEWLIFFGCVFGGKTLCFSSPRRKQLFRRNFLGLSNRLTFIHNKYSFNSYVEVEEGDVVCDVGGYCGEFTLAISGLAESVLVFEPDYVVFEYLKKNVGEIDNVKIKRRFLWDCKEELDFKVSTANADSSVFDVDSKSIDDVLSIQGVRLDGEISKMGVEKIDFLKVEAEGAEPEILKGSSFILSSVKKVAVDTSAERYGKSTASSVCSILKSYGFSVINEQDRVYAWRDCF